ncbi:MAG TPA: universal stress protein [Pirellulales bacterium]|nr:universal stress protein [Pirellulales bacterium]
MSTQKKILFATDYSESTDQVLTYAASLARDMGAKLMVAHVSQLDQYPVGELFDEEPQTSDEELAELRAIAPPDPRIACEHRLLHGEPAEEIVKLADGEHVDAIVVGTHYRSRLASLLGGSVAETLLRTAHCPVIAYRPPRPTVVTDNREVTGEAVATNGGQPLRRGGEQRTQAVTDADLQRTVKQWATRSQLYNVFQKHGIDVLWDGHRRLAEVCREKGLNPRHIADDLAAASEPAYHEAGTSWHQASITELSDHIQSTHHDYLRRELPRLGTLMAEIDAQSRSRHPELEELADVFDGFRRQLLDHIEVEQTVLFPALRLAESGEMSAGKTIVDPHGLTRQMSDDHDRIATALLRIRRLTNGYTPPPDASAAYRKLVGGLWELEATLQLAMREEDEILFPKLT